MNDNLIERYVHEVGAHLPKRNRADVQLELRSSLQDALAERGLDASNAKDAEGVAALLREFGHPEEFAARYHGEQHLIGPALYPAFKLSYSIAAIVVGVLFALGFAFGLNESGFDGQELIDLLASLADALLLNLGVVVAVFVALEHFGVGKGAAKPQTWDPHKLPKVKDSERINRTEVLVGMFFTLAALLVFNFAPGWIGVIGWQDGRFGVTPLLTEAFLAYMPWLSLVWLGEVGLKASLYRRGRWTMGLRVVELGMSVASVYLMYTIVENVEIVQVGIINAVVEAAVWIALLIGMVEAAGQLHGLLTRYRKPDSLPVESK